MGWATVILAIVAFSAAIYFKGPEKPTSVAQDKTELGYYVEKLFESDGCTVYHAQGRGLDIHYAKCDADSVTTIEKKTQLVGKVSQTYDVAVQTEMVNQ